MRNPEMANPILRVPTAISTQQALGIARHQDISEGKYSFRESAEKSRRFMLRVNVEMTDARAEARPLGVNALERPYRLTS